MKASCRLRVLSQLVESEAEQIVTYSCITWCSPVVNPKCSAEMSRRKVILACEGEDETEIKEEKECVGCVGWGLEVPRRKALRSLRQLVTIVTAAAVRRHCKVGGCLWFAEKVFEEILVSGDRGTEVQSQGPIKGEGMQPKSMDLRQSQRGRGSCLWR